MTLDPGERVDLSARHPEKLAELVADWQQYVRETGVVWGAPLKSSKAAFDGCPSDSIGGDPYEQFGAWMAVGEGEVAGEVPPIYRF